MGMVIIMVMGFLLGIVSVGADETPGDMIGSRQDVHPDLAVKAINFDNDRPYQGATVGITVHVENKGSATAATGLLSMFTKDPGDGGVLIESQPIYSLAPHVVQPYSASWSTAGFRGTFNIFVSLTDIFPEEKNTTWENNNRTADLFVFKKGAGGDIIADGTEISDIEGNKLMKNFVAAFDSSHVTFQNCSVNFSQQRDFQYALVVADNAFMNIFDCHIWSEFMFYVKVMDDGILSIANSVLDNAIIQSTTDSNGSEVQIANTHVTGGLYTAAETVIVHNTTILGMFGLFNNGAMFIESEINFTSQSVVMTDTKAFFTDTKFIGDLEDGFVIDGMSNVTLTNTSSPAFLVKGKAEVSIYRYLHVTALDLTELPISNAVVTVYFQDAANVDNRVVDEMSDGRGKLSFTLQTDKIYANEGHDPFANYELNGTVIGSDNVEYAAFTTVTLPIYNFTTGIMKTEKFLNLWFQPLPQDKSGPKFRVESRKQVTDYEEGFAVQSGVIIEAGGTLVLENSYLYVEQSRDFEVDVIIKGTIEFHNGGITSNHKVNIYIIDGTMTGVATGRTDLSFLHVNAIIGIGGAVVDLKSMDIKCDIRGHFAKLDVQGSKSRLEGHFQASVSTMTFDGVSIYDYTMKNAVLTGAEVAIKNGDFIVNNFRVSTTTKASFDGLRMRGNPYGSKTGYTDNSSLYMASSACSIQNSDIEFADFGFDCDSLAGTDSTVNRPLIDFAKGSGHTLINVTTPNIAVTGDAMVTTHWKLTITVLNLRSTPLSGISVKVTPDDMSLQMVTKTTNNKGVAEFYLKASEITDGGKNFMGNYEVTVTGKGDDQKESVSMITNVQRTFVLNYFPPVEAVRVSSLWVNATQAKAPGTEVRVKGTIQLEYEGGVLDSGPAVLVNISITWGYDMTKEIAPELYTDMNGNFSLIVTLPYGFMVFYDDIITVEDAIYTAPDGSTVNLDRNVSVAVSIIPPDPGEDLSVDSLRTDKKEYVYPDDLFIIIYGYVNYANGEPATGATITATFLTKSSDEVQVRTDGSFTLTVEIPEGIDPEGPVPAVKVNANMKGDIFNETKIHDGVGTKKVIVQKAAAETPQEGLPIIIWISIIVIVVVVVVALVAVFVYMQKQWGVLVECGECGAFIKEDLPKCPKCGTDFEAEVVKCSECSAWIPAMATDCPKCGVAFKDIKKEQLPPGTPPPPDGTQPVGKPQPVKPIPTAAVKPVPKPVPRKR